MVLLKLILEDGFVFFTNLNSNKGSHFIRNKKLSMCFYWESIHKQIRVIGTGRIVDNKISDKYFNSRPRKSKIAAWASKQSSKLEDSKDLLERFEYYENKFKNEDIPYPDFWGGYLIKPTSIEFWQGRSSRMHDRILYQKKSGNWELCKLYP